MLIGCCKGNIYRVSLREGKNLWRTTLNYEDNTEVDFETVHM